MYIVQEQPANNMLPTNSLPTCGTNHISKCTRKAVVVHAGARDSYQLALAFSEAGLLEELVTDLFWPETSKWSKILAAALPAGLRSTLRKRTSAGLLSHVRQFPVAGLKSLLLDRARWLSFETRTRLTRSADSTLGRAAGVQALRNNSELVSYSYYAASAFKAFGRGGILFQMHPHPASMRRILNQELALHPECGASLKQEWELALTDEEFDQLVLEPQMASRILVASSFTRNTLIENGIEEEKIAVIPYGVDLDTFHPSSEKTPIPASGLRLLFVGRINQRKGLKYLLEALRLLGDSSVHLLICGRVLDDLAMFAPFRSQVEIKPSVTRAELVHAYQQTDLFVFPSVAEGFGQVLLEALACGLPVLSTTHTAAPDLITDGQEGFIVHPRRPDLLAERIAWAATHRSELAHMGLLARQKAESFSWARFRRGVVRATSDVLQADSIKEAAGVAHAL